mmetsp:Transcript_168496/g.541504  ORF Transcript_168496/g.541504 Transcript_168496/m.541504 type:complete len:451 (+) Transcript_168496:229-1581(+)
MLKASCNRLLLEPPQEVYVRDVTEGSLRVLRVHLEQERRACRQTRFRELRHKRLVHLAGLLLTLAALHIEDGLNASRKMVNPRTGVHDHFVVLRVRTLLQRQHPLQLARGPRARGVHVVGHGRVVLAPLGPTTWNAARLSRLAALALRSTVRGVGAIYLHGPRRQDKTWIVCGVHADFALRGVHRLRIHDRRREAVGEGVAPTRAAEASLRARHPRLPISIAAVVELVDQDASCVEVVPGSSGSEARIDLVQAWGHASRGHKSCRRRGHRFLRGFTDLAIPPELVRAVTEEALSALCGAGPDLSAAAPPQAAAVIVPCSARGLGRRLHVDCVLRVDTPSGRDARLALPALRGRAPKRHALARGILRAAILALRRCESFRRTIVVEVDRSVPRVGVPPLVLDIRCFASLRRLGDRQRQQQAHHGSGTARHCRRAPQDPAQAQSSHCNGRCS